MKPPERTPVTPHCAPRLAWPAAPPFGWGSRLAWPGAQGWAHNPVVAQSESAGTDFGGFSDLVHPQMTVTFYIRAPFSSGWGFEPLLFRL